MRERFIGEAIEPIGGPVDLAAMARGGPGLPSAFTWRGGEYSVSAVLETWKTTGDCRSGSAEQYIRKHWFRIRTTDGTEMRIYFERQARSSRERKRRWWLYALVPADDA